MAGDLHYVSSAAILNALLVNPKSMGTGSSTMRLFAATGSNSWTSGDYSACLTYESGSTTAGGAVPLYLGLIFQVGTAAPPASSDSFFNATGTGWATGYGEITIQGGSGTGYSTYRRQPISFEGTTDDGSSTPNPRVVSTSSTITFPALDSSGILSNLALVGFFITTQQPGVTNQSTGTTSGATRPTTFPSGIILAGTVSAARLMAANDQPLFNGGGIAVSLD